MWRGGGGGGRGGIETTTLQIRLRTQFGMLDLIRLFRKLNHCHLEMVVEM